MIRVLVVLLAVAGCGIKGDPLPVDVGVSGRAEVGVTTSSQG